MDPDRIESCRKGRWWRSLRSLLLLLSVWGVVPGETWPQTHEQEPQDFGPVREPIFVIDDGATVVALQGDGKIVAAGTSDRGFAVVRYHPDGSLDASFGSGGKVTTNFPAPPVPVPANAGLSGLYFGVRSKDTTHSSDSAPSLRHLDPRTVNITVNMAMTMPLLSSSRPMASW